MNIHQASFLLCIRLILLSVHKKDTDKVVIHSLKKIETTKFLAVIPGVSSKKPFPVKVLMATISLLHF